VSDFAVFDAGWRCWAGMVDVAMFNGKRPYDYVEVEIWREGWNAEQLVDPCQLPPMMNMAGLWWRPAGPLRSGR
jgi:hypothetical protein